MKKLMIAAAIVCAAAFAHAAAYDWSGTIEIYDWNGDGVAGVGTVQFTIAGVVQEALTLSNGAADFEYTVNAGDTVSAIATINNFADGAGTKEWSFAFTQAFIDGKPTSDDALGAMTTDAMTAFDAEGAGINFELSAAENTYTAVPEPTSGLLLLLGVAGLALRRRRA